MHKRSTRELAIALRKSGYSYQYISDKTGISKSTLSGWLTDIPYTANTETVAVQGKARAAAGERKAVIRQTEMHNIRTNAETEIGELSQRDLYMLGLGLYVGEGTKTHNIIRVANSDPRVMQCMVAWFLGLGVRKSQFTARLYLYPDSNEAESLQFWSKTINIPQSQFQKTYIDRRMGKRAKKEGKLPYGTLHLGVRSDGRKEYGVLFFRRIQSLSEIVLKRVNAGLV